MIWKPTREQQEILELLRNQFSLTFMEQPFEYIKSLQNAFDYKKIKYQPEYYEMIPAEVPVDAEGEEWKVFFHSGFWIHRGRDKAGNEITVGKRFEWNGNLWYVPAVYVCKAGLVVDFCIEIDLERIRQFIEKWEMAATDEERLSPEERELLESENSLNIDFYSKIVVNGKELRRKSGCSMSWIPQNCRVEGTRNETEWHAIMKHYQLDSDRGWIIQRYSYPWDLKRKPMIQSLQVNLEQRPLPITTKKFKTPEIGTNISVVHPLTSEEYMVTIQNVEKQEIDKQKIENDEYEYPTHFTMMSYTFTPEMPVSEVSIVDCLQSDSPKRKQQAGGIGACAIGMIGGADGSTAIFMTTKSKDARLHAACSALHFEPVDEVEWKIVFRVKLCEDLKVALK